MTLLEKIVSRIQMMIGRALIEAVTDSGQLQIVKISGLDNEVQDSVERLQNYGISSNPPVGSEAVVLFVGGSRDNGLVVSVDSGEYRVTDLKSGEVVLYSRFGKNIKLNEDGEIEIGGNTDYAVAFTNLKSAFDTLKGDFNTFASTHVHPGVTTGPGSTAVVAGYVPTTASVDGAKVEKVRL